MCVVSKVMVLFCVLYTKQNGKMNRHARVIQCRKARVTVKKRHPNNWNRRLSGRDGNTHAGINKFKQAVLDHFVLVLN